MSELLANMNINMNMNLNMNMNMNNMNISIESKKADCSERRAMEACSALPRGWQREEVLRKSGLSAGKVDVYYYSPAGKKIENKPQLARHLGESMDISTFDYQAGKLVTNSHQLLQRTAMKKKLIGTSTAAFRQQFDYSRGIRTDASLVPPIRQTASIFKQPVTVYKTQESKVKTDLKHGPQEKPKQLFWEKRIEGLRACDIDGSEFGPVELPKGLKPVGPHVNEGTLLQSIATALHVSVQPVTGQTASKSALTANSSAFLNPDQPLMHAVTISEDDIRRQEDRVALARKKLQDALKV